MRLSAVISFLSVMILVTIQEEAGSFFNKEKFHTSLVKKNDEFEIVITNQIQQQKRYVSTKKIFISPTAE